MVVFMGGDSARLGHEPAFIPPLPSEQVKFVDNLELAHLALIAQKTLPKEKAQIGVINLCTHIDFPIHISNCRQSLQRLL